MSYFYEEINTKRADDMLGTGLSDLAQFVLVGASLMGGLPKPPRITYFKRADESSAGEAAVFRSTVPECGHAKPSINDRIWVAADSKPDVVLKTIAHEVHHLAQFAKCKTYEETFLKSSSDAQRQAWEAECDKFEKIVMRRAFPSGDFVMPAKTVDNAPATSTKSLVGLPGLYDHATRVKQQLGL